MKRLLSGLTCLLFGACSNSSEKAVEQIIQTPNGPVVSHETVVKAGPQTITIVDGQDLIRLKSLGDKGPSFIETYQTDAKTARLEDYDQAFRSWQLDPSPQYTREEVIEILGGVLGNQCVDELDMEWVVVEDEYGTDYAVRSKTVEVMGFPFSTVMKRIDDQQFDFLDGVFHALKERVNAADVKARSAK